MNMNFCKDVQYIGCDDTTLDLFESQYPIPNGVSYNSYVIMDEKIAVMDTADGRVSEKWFENLEKALNGRTPDYLIVSHLEPDHAKNIGAFLDKYPMAKMVGNAKTFTIFPEYFTTDVTDRKLVVKEGDELNLGKHALTFIMTPMVHWPEVMMCYEKSEKILFSADAFGTFGALFNTDDWLTEARRYYTNIVGKYGASVQGVLKKASNLDIQTICPLHGPVLTGDLGYYLEKYEKWANYTPEEEGVVVAYASIHGNTAGAAKFLAKQLEDLGHTVSLIDLTRVDVSYSVAEVFRMNKLVCLGCTYDGGLFPAMHDFLLHLKWKNVQNRKVWLVENGSWAPQAGKVMTEILSGMKGMTVAENVITLKGGFKEENKQAFIRLAKEI